MASKEELDLDVEQKPAGNKKNLILYIIIGVLVLALGGVTAFFLFKGGHKAEGEQAAATEQEQTKEGEPKEAHYLGVEKLVVNFGQGEPVRFLQVNLQLMSHDESAIKAMELHMPAIRNDILLLLGGQHYAAVSTPEGKEKLREDILAKVQAILDERAKGKKVDAVYFTEFIMQ